MLVNKTFFKQTLPHAANKHSVIDQHVYNTDEQLVVQNYMVMNMPEFKIIVNRGNFIGGNDRRKQNKYSLH